ncbi:unnamed protein product [Brassicogethes aeneus]|uniref:Hexosyltransferase n=1 Tax=Brassicogethes aeneus TaxID=1431903 RepID=A0A9P0FB13_BRAAE|nr:unnamed protein product [Brassicogethes aeneus]
MKALRRFINDNIYVFLGILIGLYVSILIQEQFDVECKHKNDVQRNESNQQILSNFNKSLPIINVPKKGTASVKKKIVRPRYYSTELGIREKMFIGIFTSEEKINSQAVHINKTIGHIANKIKFFMTAQYKLKNKFNLTGLVGFTDSRTRYRPFQVVKYVGDSFGQDYDYYFLANDYTYINIHRLNDLVKKISVSMHVYLGTKVQDSSYCSLDSGILISNSVLKAMRDHLDWCIINTVSDDHSENFGRCVYHSIGLKCQDSIQGVSWRSFKIRHFELNEHLLDLTQKEEFNNAITVQPVIQDKDIYLLNSYFLRQRLENIKKETDEISKSLTDQTWPPGQRIGAKPATRFDVPKQYYFNMSHTFFYDDFTVLKKHTEPELQDIEYILEEIKAKVYSKNSELTFKTLINGYKKFDLSRGLDYIFDLEFRDSNTDKNIIKRFEVCKPLGNVEFLQVPYVTETSRVTILLPIQVNQVQFGLGFLKGYINNIMDRKEKTFLMLVLLYQYTSEGKGEHDIFNEVKNIVTKTSNKYKNDDAKIAWVSVRLPESKKPIYTEEYKSLNFAIVDLALKKIGLESLTLVLDVYCNITVDFLNRVRMNTIQNFQIFNPIPFRQYNPKITQINNLEVNKNIGHFDRDQYKYISFYGNDYVYARKKFQNVIPLMRIDNDISKIIDEDTKNTGNIFEMFLKHHKTLHCMRATEMNLKVIYHDETQLQSKNLFLGNNAQLAKIILNKKEL